MLNLKYSVSATLAALVFSTTSSIAMANDEIQLDEVVVTATKSKTNLFDAPAAVTLITDQQISAKNTARLGDALLNVPSLFLRAGALGDSQGTQGTSGMSLRGVDHKKVLVLIDGKPLQDAGSGQINWRSVMVEDIARIEVVPGAFSSLYGSNAIGGVINILTKQANQHELSLKFKNGWGDAAGQDASVYVRERSEQGWGVVAGLAIQNRDSYANDFVLKTASTGAAGTAVTGAQSITTSAGAPAYLVGDKGAAPWRQLNATAKVFYDVSAQDKVFAGVALSETKLGYSPFNSYLRNAAGMPVSSGNLGINGQLVKLSESNFLNNSPLLESAVRYFTGYEGLLANDIALKIEVARINRQYQFVNADTTATWAGGTGTQSDAPNSGTDANLSLNFPLGQKQTIVTGIALHREVVDSQTFNLANWRDPATATAVSSGFSGDSRTTSFFIQDEMSLHSKFKVFVGGRYDDWQTQGAYFKSSTPVAAVNYATRSASSLTNKLSGVYQPLENLNLRASFGQSFRAPSNQDLYAYSNIAGITSIGDPNLKPEKGTSWELGSTWRVAARTQVGVTYFQTMIEDLLTNYRISNLPIISQRINAGRAKINGLELSAETPLNDYFDVTANYSVINSEMLENAIDPLSVGKRLIDSPKNIAGLGVQGQYGSWSVTLTAQYYSKIFSTAQNTDTAEGVPGAYDARTLVNGKIAYGLNKFTKVSVAINNLLNQQSYSYFLNPGRSVVAELDFFL
jgi:iron complex outermembrane receptor protein